MGGGTKKQCGISFLKNLTTGLIWLVTKGGGWGEAWGGGPWRAGKGGDGGGGHQRAVWEQQKVHWLFWAPNWSDLAGDEGGGEWGGRRGEVAHGGRARGEMGGHQRAVWEQQKSFRFFPSKPQSDLAGDEGGGMGGRRGEVAQRAVWEQQKVHTLKPNNWSDLAGDEGWGDGGRRGGGGPWRAGKGGDGGRGGPWRAGGTREQQKVHWFPF